MTSDLNGANAAGPPESAESPRRRHRWRLLGVLLIFIIGVLLLVHVIGRNKPAQASVVPTIPVVAATARIGNLPIYLNGLGSVTPVYTVTVRTRVDGQLFSVPVREGQMVSAGDIIAEIDPRPFDVQLLQAQGQKEKDEAFLANAKVDLERYRVLYSQNAVPQQQFATQLATVNQYEAIVKADEGAIESAKLNLTYAHITAPISGRIGLRMVDPGNIVHAADQNGLLVITQLQPITVIFNIAEDYIPQVMKKLQAGQRMPVDAWDRDFKTKIATGTLLTVDNQVDANTGTVRFKASFPNRDNSMFPSQFVNARLLIDMKRNTVLIPTAAIQHGPQATFVFVVKPDNTVEMRNIVPGPVEKGTASVDQGLNAGDVVVTEGVDKLQQGTKVNVSQNHAALSP
jgi:multidrug efflux system membrane fusion protein